MGSHPNISATKFPKQSKDCGKDVDVCFHYDTSKIVKGVVVRDDAVAPFVMLIKLADGRIVMATECQYSFN